MTLSKQQIKAFKAQAHSLNPVVIIGQKGLTQAVIDEIDSSIEKHSLMKIRINEADKEARLETAHKICAEINADFIGSIGHIVIIYRKPKDD